MIRPVHLMFLVFRAQGALASITGISALVTWIVMAPTVLQGSTKDSWPASFVFGASNGLFTLAVAFVLFVYADSLSRRWQGARPDDLSATMVALAGICLGFNALCSLPVAVMTLIRTHILDGDRLGPFSVFPVRSALEDVAYLTAGTVVFLLSRRIARWADRGQWQSTLRRLRDQAILRDMDDTE